MAYRKTKNLTQGQLRSLNASVYRYQAARQTVEDRRDALRSQLTTLVDGGVTVAEVARNCSLTTHQVANIISPR
jgi:hypothetical protein